MSHTETQPEAPLPRQRPEVTVTPSDEAIFAVDWRELAWWSAVPEIGDHVRWGIYDPPDWQMTSRYDLRALHPAEIHGLEGVEILGRADDLTGKDGIVDWSLFARVTEDHIQCLAVLSLREGRRRLYTMLDEGFDEDWWQTPRHPRNTGRFVRQPDGSYRQRKEALREGETVEVIDVCRVTVGEHSFTCLHVIDVPQAVTEESILMEGFLSHEGRTILDRRYNAPQWHRGAGSAYADKPPWDERFPTHNRIVIDGVTFTHWYDGLTNRALGMTG